MKCLIEQVFPKKIVTQPMEEEKTIVRCIKRFIARHPTRATTRLLQLLGAAGDLKKAA
jgi:hypothetical protein